MANVHCSHTAFINKSKPDKWGTCLEAQLETSALKVFRCADDHQVFLEADNLELRVEDVKKFRFLMQVSGFQIPFSSEISNDEWLFLDLKLYFQEVHVCWWFKP